MVMKEWLDDDLVAEVRDYLLENPGPVTTSAVASALARSGRVLGSAAVLELVAKISAQLAGAGPLQPLLDDVSTTDVFVNGPRDVWADHGEGCAGCRCRWGPRRMCVRWRCGWRRWAGGGWMTRSRWWTCGCPTVCG